jgi:programmed cell death 6-interacting protein
LKAAFFNAEAYYRCTIDFHEKTKIGEEIAWLQVEINAIVDVKRTAWYFVSFVPTGQQTV